MHLLDPGDRVVAVNDVYGGVYRMFSQVYEPKGYRFTYVTPERALHRARRRTSTSARDPLARDADQPAAEHRRHRGRRRGGARGRRDGRRRQHVRHAVPAAAARARRGHRRPLHDEVPRWPLGRGRRLRRHERPDDRGASAVPAEVARRRPRSVRRVARAARAEDACDPDGAALCERQRGRRVPGPASAGHDRALAGTPGASGPRDRRPADARLRRDGLVPRRDGGGGCRALLADDGSGRSPRASAASRASSSTRRG